MRIVVICRTPIHVFRSIQLKYFIWQTDDVDLYVFDTFPRSDVLSEKIRDVGLFEHVYYFAENKNIVKGKMSDFRSVFRRGEFQEKLSEVKYDELFVFNLHGTFIEVAYNIIRRNNQDVVFNMVEDGPSIYYVERRVSNSVEKVFPLFGLKSAQDNIDVWWFSRPDMMEVFGDGVKKALPRIDRDERKFVELINDVFSYSPSKSVEDADVLFMEECYRNDGLLKTDDDKDLFGRIMKEFPQHKYLLKLHPRTKVNRFDNLCEVLPQDGIPWEVYALNYRMNDKILISISCTTMVSSTLLYGDETYSLLLYPLLKNKVIDKNTGKSYFTTEVEKKIVNQQELFKDKNRFCIANTYEDASKRLSEWFEKKSSL